jgi:magnesium chelatase family protein
MTPLEARRGPVTSEAASLLADAYARRGLSGRAHDRVLRLSRTVADLRGVDRVGREEMAQALQLRRRDYE